MGGFSIWHWLIIIAVLAVVFGGRGKIASIMGDTAKGIKAFKDGMKDEVDHKPAGVITQKDTEKDEAQS
jgi:sec-independent protein translocase protein TatA